MDDRSPPQRLGDITTMWTMVRQAHEASTETAGLARQVLMERYSGAVYRYLLASVRSQDVADELFQEFALRFVRGDFRNADPRRGRFRDFVKTAVFHLIVDHQSRQKRGLQVVPLDQCQDAVAVAPDRESEQAFLQSWRNEILSRTWQALEADSVEADQMYYQVLRFRAEHSQLTSAEMAERLQEVLGRPVKDTWVRQTIRRARERFARLLLEELACSLDNPTQEELEQELADLGLMPYCQDALGKG